MASPIAIADFKAYFSRDFVYGTVCTTVTDADITKAIGEAAVIFNEGLWGAVTSQIVAYQLLTAHFLVRDLQMAGGLSNSCQGATSMGTSPIQSKSAGPVSISYGLSQKVVDNPALNVFLATGYGQKYLQLLMPRLAGNVGVCFGATQP